MDIAGRARKMAAGAVGVAAATGGLSSCGLGGVVDPAPPPLVCNDVGAGQNLNVTSSRIGDVVSISIVPSGLVSRWNVASVSNVTGGVASNIVAPSATTLSPLTFSLTLGAVPPTTAGFTVQGAFTGYQGETCAYTRTFIVTVTSGSVQVAQLTLDTLPLPSRERLKIEPVVSEGNVLELLARSEFRGDAVAEWSVSAGTIEVLDARRARWRLPIEPGIHQVQLALDYGSEGLAFDAITIETTRSPGGDEREIPSE